MADFRKLFYALAIVALLAGSTVAVNAQTLTCFSLTATNQNVRIEGDAELVGDILLGCSGSGFTTPAGTLISGADITVNIPSTIITSKILNPGTSTPISEATLIVDDLKDQTCQAANTGTGGQYITNAGTTGYANNGGDGSSAVQGSNCIYYWPGSRRHQVCSDTSNPGGLGVCQVYAKASGPENSYDGLTRNPGTDGCPNPLPANTGTGSTAQTVCNNPNIFVGQPNGTGAVIFRGVPLDPPATGFTRYIRITNIRVNAAQTGLSAGNPLSQITAIISFQGPAAVGLATIQTTVASILTGNGGTKVTADNTFLQCEYPTNDLNNPPSPPGLIQEGPCSAAAPPSSTGNGNGNSTVSSSLLGTSSGIAGTAVGHGWCTVSSGGVSSINLITGALVHNVITWTEGFQTAWKGRNMSEYLGTSGQVLGTLAGCAAAATAVGSPCDAGGNANNVSSTAYYTYDGASVPWLNNNDISQNSPQIRYFTETGFEELSNTASLTIPSAFNYLGNAGSADAGTRLQSTISNIPANAVVSVPSVVWLLNGKIVSGVMVLVSTSSGNGQAPLNTAGAGNVGSAWVTPSSALASIQNGTLGGQPAPAMGAIGNPACTGNSASAPTIACAGYVDLTGPTASITYEVVVSDPYSTESAKIYPIVYYPTGDLTAKPSPILPQPNVTATVTPYTFAPYIPQPGGNQTTTPLGQNAGTPRFVLSPQTPALALFTINRCNCSLLFPWVVSDNNYVTGIVVANTSADPTNTPLAVPGYTAVQSSGTVQLYLFGTIKGQTAQAVAGPAAVYGFASDTQALAGSFATFVVSTGFDGYAIAQANFQYCHGLAFLYNASGAVPPISYLGLVMDFGGLQRTAQLIGDSLGQ